MHRPASGAPFIRGYRPPDASFRSTVRDSPRRASVRTADSSDNVPARWPRLQVRVRVHGILQVRDRGRRCPRGIAIALQPSLLEANRFCDAAPLPTVHVLGRQSRRVPRRRRPMAAERPPVPVPCPAIPILAPRRSRARDPHPRSLGYSVRALTSDYAVDRRDLDPADAGGAISLDFAVSPLHRQRPCHHQRFPGACGWRSRASRRRIVAARLCVVSDGSIAKLLCRRWRAERRGKHGGGTIVLRWKTSRRSRRSGVSAFRA